MSAVGFEYFTLRCVPRVEREEFVNVGVVLYSQTSGFLRAATALDEDRVRAVCPTCDLVAVRAALAVFEAVARGDADAGPAGGASARTRFGWLAAPRSTVLQPGPVHAGLTEDPAGELEHLLALLVV